MPPTAEIIRGYVFCVPSLLFESGTIDLAASVRKKSQRAALRWGVGFRQRERKCAFCDLAWLALLRNGFLFPKRVFAAVSGTIIFQK